MDPADQCGTVDTFPGNLRDQAIHTLQSELDNNNLCFGRICECVCVFVAAVLHNEHWHFCCWL